MKADTKVQSNDTVIKLVTTVVERANLKQALKTRLITADRIVGWTYLDESRIQFQTATGLLPETHGVAVKAPYDTIAGHPALFNWDGIDGMDFFGLFNYKYKPNNFPINEVVGDVAKLTGYLQYTNLKTAGYLDTVVPIKDLNRLTQFGVVKGRIVDMTAAGLVMARVDRVNGLLTALYTNAGGQAKRLVAVPVDRVKQDVTLLQRPDHWDVLVETANDMIFYSRSDYTDIFGKTSVHFTDKTARKLIVERGKDGQIKAKWDGLSKPISYYLVGQLAGNRDLLVGYDIHDDQNIELFFTTRDDQNVAFMA